MEILKLRLRLDLYILCDIKSDKMHNIRFLSCLTCNTSVKRTQSNIFYVHAQRTNYFNNLPVIRLIKIVNEL